MTGTELANEISMQESRMSIALPLPPLSPGRYPASPPSTPPLPQFSKEYQSFVYSKGLATQQQGQYLGANAGSSIQEGSAREVELQRERILSGQSSTDNNETVAASSSSGSGENIATTSSPTLLLPSHMQRTTPRPGFARQPLVRQASHTVSFADDVEHPESVPSTPKGHPSTGYGNGSRFGGYVDLERHMQQVELGRAKLMGYLGGGGSGLAAGIKGSGSEIKRGKIYRPTQHSHTSALGPSAATTHKFRTTISYLSRIPRKFRSILAGVVLFVLFVTVLSRSTGKAEEERQMASKRYASGLQKAFVIGQGDLDDVARHPDFHLAPNELDQAKDAQLLDAMQAEDIADAAQDTQFEPSTAHSESSEYEFTFANKKEEMAALVSFLTSTSSNALPPVDPSMPLDPQLVLEFDYTKVETAREDMAQLTEDVFSLFPVIMVGRMRDPHHREMLRIMSQYTSNPPPLVIEVDQRRDAETLVPLLARLLDTDEMPQVIVMGEAAGGHKQLGQLQESGGVKEYFAGLGVEMKDKKMKKKPKYIKDAERREKERILGPKPIMADEPQVQA
ncbi:hypothetical protein FFLO_05494 [Filobasidium floriforme]|uniref:Glutaredoxin domain-containing protein n=1 Tax=Filobasidium floriforme TaxID=5210 RepID=A0A8K0JGS3_9TREE|nr:hypothetical protein FFLO_05494 [Filobasidium floriforme]